MAWSFNLFVPHALQSSAGAGPVLGMDGVRERAGRIVQTLATQPPDALVGRIDIKDLRHVGIADPQNRIDVLGQLPETFLTLTQSCVGARSCRISLALQGARVRFHGRSSLEFRKGVGRWRLATAG